MAADGGPDRLAVVLGPAHGVFSDVHICEARCPRYGHARRHFVAALSGWSAVRNSAFHPPKPFRTLELVDAGVGTFLRSYRD
jgi:hypothetical protein